MRVSEPGDGGAPMMPASMNGAPVSSMSVAMRTTVCGAIALHSANAGRAPVRAIAPATSSAMGTASAGGSTESSSAHFLDERVDAARVAYARLGGAEPRQLAPAREVRCHVDAARREHRADGRAHVAPR